MDIASETSDRSLARELPPRQKSPSRIEVPSVFVEPMQQANRPKPSPNRNDWISRFVDVFSCRSASNVSDPSLLQSAVEVPHYHIDHHEQKSSSNGSVALPRQESAVTFCLDSGTYPPVQNGTIEEQQEMAQAQVTTTKLSTHEVIVFDEDHIHDEFLALHDDDGHSQVEPMELEPQQLPALHRQGSTNKVVIASATGPLRMASSISNSRAEASRETVGHSSSYIIPDARSLSHSHSLSQHNSIERIPSVGNGSRSGSPYVSRSGSYDAMHYHQQGQGQQYMMMAPPPPAMIAPPQPVVMNGVLYYPQAIDANVHPHLLAQQSMSFYYDNGVPQMISPPPQMMMMQPQHMMYANASNNNSPPISYYNQQQVQQDMYAASPSPPLQRGGLTRQMSNDGGQQQYRSSSAQRSTRRRNSGNNDTLQSRSSSAGRSSRDSPSLHHGRSTSEELDYALRASMMEEEQCRMRMSADDQALHAAIMQSLHDQNEAAANHTMMSTPEPAVLLPSSSPNKGSSGKPSGKKMSSVPRLPPAGPRRVSSGQMGGHV